MTHSITALPSFSWRDSRAVLLLRDSISGSRLLSLHAVLMMAGFAVALLLMLWDTRMIAGAGVWHKPAKFFFSLAVQFATVAWALSLVPPDLRSLRSVRIASVAMIAAGWGEMAYIVFRAARGEASHFNQSDLFAQIAYALMGIGALTLTVTAGWIGIVLWRQRGASLWRMAAGLGLMLGAVLTTLVAFHLSNHAGGHWVGGAATDAGGLRLFLWSTTGGDLRVAHFVALHAMQIVPFAALSGRRSVVAATALAVVLATVALFLQAVWGIPLFTA